MYISIFGSFTVSKRSTFSINFHTVTGTLNLAYHCISLVFADLGIEIGNPMMKVWHKSQGMSICNIMRDKFEIHDWFRDMFSLNSIERKPIRWWYVDSLDFARLFRSFYKKGKCSNTVSILHNKDQLTPHIMKYNYFIKVGCKVKQHALPFYGIDVWEMITCDTNTSWYFVSMQHYKPWIRYEYLGNVYLGVNVSQTSLPERVGA